MTVGGRRAPRRVAVLLGVALVLLSPAGCARQVDGSAVGDGGPPVSNSAGPDTDSSTPVSPGAGALAQIVGTWTGSYVCAQGETSLTLAVETARPNNPGLADATFTFSTGADAATAVHGSYLMSVASQPTGAYEFTAVRWLQQPAGYVMVGLTGQLTDDGHLAGAVHGIGCTTFDVTRGGSG